MKERIQKMKNKLNSIIQLHDKMKNCFFWSSPSSSASRRNYESYNSLESSVMYNNQVIKVIQNTSCSCKNIYYSMKIYVNDELVNKDIRFIKKMLKESEIKEVA